jgi:hypothetical protein
VDSLSKRDSAKARKMPKNAARTPSRVHALLAGFCQGTSESCVVPDQLVSGLCRIILLWSLISVSSLV